MNSKTVFLILLVILIWGVIGYKVFEALSDDAASPAVIVKPKAKLSDGVKYDLNLAYPDPFLRTETVKQTTLTVTKDNVEAKEEPVDWSRVKYRGMLQNVPKLISVASLTVDNEEFIVRENEMVNGFTLIRIEPDSIYISCNKKYFYIKLDTSHE